MTTKIIINGKAGEPIDGKNIRLEVDGKEVEGEISLDINASIGEVATAMIKMVLPEIEYREE